MKRTFQIHPLDPLMIRDGRPFDETPGSEAHSMNDIAPSVLAGSLRSLLGKASSTSSSIHNIFKSTTIQQLVKSPVRGPLYLWNDSLVHPLPQDMDVYGTAEGIKVSIRRPEVPAEDQGFLGVGKLGHHTDKLWPVKVPHTMKPYRCTPAFVSHRWMKDWLIGGEAQQAAAEALEEWCMKNEHLEIGVHPDFIAPFEKEKRTHAAINDQSGTAEEQKLFDTEALVIPPEMSLLADIETITEEQSNRRISDIHSLGGKRGLAYFKEVDYTGFWDCPEIVLHSVNEAPRYLRMTLATPAYFAKGWLPGWLNEHLESGSAFEDVELKLRWACLPRWQPISGWSYRHNEAKAVRRMVPAGSVYFFEVIKGNPLELVKSKWLTSVSDANRRKEAFDKEDGFGLALWGTWSPQVPL